MIRSYYKLSNATCCRLKKTDKNYHDENASRDVGASKRHLSEEAKMLVTKLVEPPKSPIVIKDLQRKLFEILQEQYGDIVIRKYLRDTLKYSFK